MINILCKYYVTLLYSRTPELIPFFVRVHTNSKKGFHLDISIHEYNYQIHPLYYSFFKSPLPF
jgi:hypothetical protein